MAYTLNMLAKKIEVMLLLVVGFLLTGHRPLLMVLIIFLNDFLTMALTTGPDERGVAIQSMADPCRRMRQRDARLLQIILQPRGIPVRELPPAAGTGAIANADLCDGDPEFPGRSVSARRAPPLLDLAAQPRNVLVHVLAGWA
jgi:hypothetical protein